MTDKALRRWWKVWKGGLEWMSDCYTLDSGERDDWS
jgi:hypothetical protein